MEELKQLKILIAASQGIMRVYNPEQAALICTGPIHLISYSIINSLITPDS